MKLQFRAVATVFAAALTFSALTACAAEPESSAPSAADAAAQNSQDPQSSEAADQATLSEQPSDDTAADSADSVDADKSSDPGSGSSNTSLASGGEECLVGEWLFTTEEMQRFYDEVSSTKINVFGDTKLKFDGTDFVFDSDFGIEMVIGVEAEGNLKGVVGGSYIANEKTVTTTKEYDDFEAEIVIMGQTMDGTSELGGFVNMFQMNETPYVCAGDTLHLDFAAGGDDRVRLELARQR